MHIKSVDEHYAKLLAPVYLWMAGGLDHALKQGEADVKPFVPGHGLAVDLGAGFGVHAIALARGGWEVLAIDSSEFLLEQLAEFGAGLPIRPARADLRDFAAQLQGRAPRLILCMGDTLTHLADQTEVEALLREVAVSLAPGGRFVVSFRDYSHPPAGAARFISVRSDADRIMTCFLETKGGRVIVHDLLHERGSDGWSVRVSAYSKLPVDPEFVVKTLTRAGLRASVEPDRWGMAFLSAEK
jgi:SAM-dependent methyltransferase